MILANGELVIEWKSKRDIYGDAFGGKEGWTWIELNAPDAEWQGHNIVIKIAVLFVYFISNTVAQCAYVCNST